MILISTSVCRQFISLIRQLDIIHHGIFESAVASRRLSVRAIVPPLAGLATYVIAVAAALNLLNDGDTLSHIVIGQWIIENRTLPFHDPFSYTFRGGVWVPHEWLAEVMFAAIYGWLGWGGVVAVTALAIAVAFALLAGALQSVLGPRRALIGAALALLLSEPHLLARPHVLALPLLVMWMAAVIQARDAGRVPPLAALPIMTLWCNLHGGFVVGLLFVGLLAAEAVLQAPAVVRRRAASGWGVFLALSGLAALVSPNGLELFRLPLRMLSMSFATSALSEWGAANFQSFEPLEVWIMLAIFGGFSLGLRLPWTRTAMVLLLLHLALRHVRNMELLGIIGPLLIAGPLAAQLGSPNRAANGAEARVVRLRFAAATAIALGVLSTALLLDRRGLHPRGSVAPVTAVNAARAAGLNGHVLNSLRFGGYLMFVGIPTFIDGRADLFGDEFLARNAAASAGIGDALPDLLDQYAVAWTLLEPSSPAASLLDHLPGWERVYADQFAAVHRRTPLRSDASRSNGADGR
jgi:hypothetical protein